MAEIENIFTGGSTQEEQLLTAFDVMRTYIEDFYTLDYGLLNVDADSEAYETLWGLRERSRNAIATLFERFSGEVYEDQRYDAVMSVLFPFLQDQFEVRMKLIQAYWERMKAQKFVTANPDFEHMGNIIGQLIVLIQECGDMGAGKEKETTAES